MEFKASGINAAKVREKVAVKPGFHLVDWNRLIRAMSPAVGKEAVKITPEELAQHNNKYDCWMAYKGKVYNVTQYMSYHPGGAEILMECAGMDCTEQFDHYHKWVNVPAMLGKCLVGVLEAPAAAAPATATITPTTDEDVSTLSSAVDAKLSLVDEKDETK
jgi:cytochrome-b5 reductase|eukprot:gene20238-14795_t